MVWGNIVSADDTDFSKFVQTLIIIVSVLDSKPRIQVRYRKGPLSQRSAHAEQYVQTKTNTDPSPDPNRYRRRCPDPNAGLQKFIHYMAIAAICDSGLSPNQSLAPRL